MADKPIPEMVLRVAKALDPDAFSTRNPMQPGLSEEALEKAYYQQRSYPARRTMALKRAILAIEAIRSPTESMTNAGFNVETERYAVHHPQEDACAIDVWHAMMDVALEV